MPMLVIWTKPSWAIASILLGLISTAADVSAQTPPSAATVAGYQGLHHAAYESDFDGLHQLIAKGADLEARDTHGRTPIHVAAFASNEQAVKMLAEAGADVNAFDDQAYDIITIAAVASDLDILDVAIAMGGDPANITSPYDGTALIAAAHLGHHEAVSRLIAAGAPLDHVNNLGWTAIIEAIVLGDGGADHIKSLQALLNAGANRTIADRQGVTPLQHAQARGYEKMILLLRSE